MSQSRPPPQRPCSLSASMSRLTSFGAPFSLQSERMETECNQADSCSVKKAVSYRRSHFAKPVILLAPTCRLRNIRPSACGSGSLAGLELATKLILSMPALVAAEPRGPLELVRKTTPEDQPPSIQIYGNEPEFLQAAAKWLQDCSVTTIDINMGCPVHKVTKGGGGALSYVRAPKSHRPG